MSKTKYIARLDGVVVGTRRSDRTYTHAIVAQLDEALARAEAYSYLPTNSDLNNFNYYTEIAEQGIQHRFARRPSASEPWRTDADSVEQIHAALYWIEGGWDAYVAKMREIAICRFEAMKEKGAYEPKVIAWAGRPDLARKRAAEADKGYYKWVNIVPAEVA
jgi:hypothetical protein